MDQMKLLIGALFRPSAAFARLKEGVKWAWMPALVVLLASSLANVAATVPLQVAEQIRMANEQMAEPSESGPAVKRGGGARVTVEESGEAEKKRAEAVEQRGDDAGEMGDLVAPPPDAAASAVPMAMTAGLVFGAVGVIASLLVTALFFFVAGKVWAKRVAFPAYLSMVALAFLPLALRDVLQAVYQTATGTWIQHQGVSSLVAAKDALFQGGIAYGVLSQVDLWGLWAVVLLYLGVRGTAGFEKKRGVIAVVLFAVIAVALRAAPAIVTGAFAGAGA